jgi:hypothetical protein
MDGLTAAYFVAFVAGAGFSIVSWLLGAVGSQGDQGSDHGAHGAAEADSLSDGVDEAAGSGHLHVDLHLGGHSVDAGAHAASHGLAAGHGPGHALAAGHDVAHGPAAVHGQAPALAHGHGHALAPGHGHGSTEAQAHGHSSTEGHAHAHEGLAARVVGPLLNLSSLAALSCIGGGAGLIARRMGAGAPLSLAIAIPSGMVAAYAIGGLIAYLRRESRFKEPTQLGGQLGTLLAPTSSEHLGEVMYVIDGARATLPARSTKSTVLEPGTEVVILDVKDGIARVGAATELLGIEAAPAAEARRQLPHGDKERAK